MCSLRIWNDFPRNKMSSEIFAFNTSNFVIKRLGFYFWIKILEIRIKIQIQIRIIFLINLDYLVFLAGKNLDAFLIFNIRQSWSFFTFEIQRTILSQKFDTAKDANYRSFALTQCILLSRCMMTILLTNKNPFDELVSCRYERVCLILWVFEMPLYASRVRNFSFRNYNLPYFIQVPFSTIVTIIQRWQII